MPKRKETSDVFLADRNPEYDANAKKLISSRSILSWILKYCVEEFADVPLDQIRDFYILGTPEVASVPVGPDETNVPHRILGENGEYKTVTEGMTTFDIRFRAKTPNGETLGLIINVEAQKSSKLRYPLLKRALYYCSRLISSQNGVDFEGDDYGKIQKVYSIWLCMDTPNHTSGITKYKIQEELSVGGIVDEKANYDLQQVVMVYIGDDTRRLQNRLLSMLYDLFKADGSAREKKKTLREKYDVVLNHNEERLVDTMCNLSEGIAEKHYYRGLKQGEAEGDQKVKNMVLNLLKLQVPISIIAKSANIPEDQVRELGKGNHLLQ